MVHTVKAYDFATINIAPKSMKEEILQNIAMIISTPKFTVPLDRGFGLAQRFLDKPIQAARAILISEVMDAIETYEPRVEIVAVTFSNEDKPGKLVSIVEVNIIDE